jgi:hypothetical protein
MQVYLIDIYGKVAVAVTSVLLTTIRLRGVYTGEWWFEKIGNVLLKSLCSLKLPDPHYVYTCIYELMLTDL